MFITWLGLLHCECSIKKDLEHQWRYTSRYSLIDEGRLGEDYIRVIANLLARSIVSAQ